MDAEQLKREIAQLSSAAFHLAQDAALQRSNTLALEQQARSIDSRLDELAPLIDTVPATEQPGLDQAWTDARLDITYILSGATGPTSTRLFHFLNDQKHEA